MKKLHTAPLVINIKNPNAQWKPSNSQVSKKCSMSETLFHSSIQMTSTKKSLRDINFLEEILHLLCQSQRENQTHSYYQL